jgi:hypothetical protein
MPNLSQPVAGARRDSGGDLGLVFNDQRQFRSLTIWKK